jgi:hypothetical protein
MAKEKASEAKSAPADTEKPEADTEAKAPLSEKGPTIAEWCAANYKATGYPPAGFASKSTQEEIDAAIEAQAAGLPVAGVEDVKRDDDGGVIAEASGDEVDPSAPAQGTREAAEAHLADFPDHPTTPGAKIIDRPLTSGASG